MDATLTARADIGDATEEIFFTGALPPDPLLENVVVSLDDIERRIAAMDLPKSAGEPGTGADLLSSFGPVRHQGKRGTCVAHAVCALAECRERSSQGNDADLSEQYLYWSAKRSDGFPERSGTTIEVAVDRLVADGVCTESMWPYVRDPISGNESQDPPPAGAADEAHNHKLASYEGVTGQHSGVIRARLDGRRPVALSVPVFPNWVGNPMLKASGFIPMPLPGSKPDTGHAMCAVGYAFDDEFAGGGYLVLRNSWGEDFASQSPVARGHALLPFSYWDDYGWEAFTWVP
jgi:hypothetical protein